MDNLVNPLYLFTVTQNDSIVLRVRDSSLSLGMTGHNELMGGGKQGRFARNHLNADKLGSKRPCFPP